MRTPLALAAVATAVVGLGSPATALTADATATSASQTTASETSRERGVVIECGGSYRGDDLYVSVYENNLYANVFQVVVGDDGLGNIRESAKGFVEKKQVRATLKLDGRKVLVTGTAKPYGKKVAVHEEHDDAGQHIVVDGVHRKLRTDLTMRWKGRTVDLTCADAFRYDLQVTKTDTTGD
ncbi:hypothetical protein [Nocardioides deserti]|uniref:Uncharacterized protein n=1 Tax=Nocardioides deserti TaxID=1588644 RepID=A0ABR6UDH3_9ACTN|nr:hypothetical protein [Nocardioides deserti]MBC2962198.1 hypothetical protein [Nocardioides deserti]GGO67938.1 hypothetical protein GCM10012276_00580 [Nocardioides deserti]